MIKHMPLHKYSKYVSTLNSSAVLAPKQNRGDYSNME